MMHVAELGIGETVVVTAGASSMGIACIQLAKLAGASTVIALTRSAAKHQALIEAGADSVVDHRDPGAPDEIRKLVPEMGVDVVFDNHGGQELLDFSMDVLDLSGRYVLISSEATTFGNSLGIDPLRLIGKHLSLRVCRSATRRDQETVVRLAEKGKISMPVAEVVPLAEVARAHELQERSAHVGKILVSL
jgi:NADPH:quinone reductase-like Zn-dependent oxidoreductase